MVSLSFCASETILAAESDASVDDRADHPEDGEDGKEVPDRVDGAVEAPTDDHAAGCHDQHLNGGDPTSDLGSVRIGVIGSPDRRPDRDHGAPEDPAKDDQRHQAPGAECGPWDQGHRGHATAGGKHQSGEEGDLSSAVGDGRPDPAGEISDRGGGGDRGDRDVEGLIREFRKPDEGLLEDHAHRPHSGFRRA